MLTSSARYNQAFTKVWCHSFCCHSVFWVWFPVPLISGPRKTTNTSASAKQHLSSLKGPSPKRTPEGCRDPNKKSLLQRCCEACEWEDTASSRFVLWKSFPVTFEPHDFKDADNMERRSGATSIRLSGPGKGRSPWVQACFQEGLTSSSCLHAHENAAFPTTANQCASWFSKACKV